MNQGRATVERSASLYGTVVDVVIGDATIPYALGDIDLFLAHAATIDADRWLVIASDHPVLDALVDRVERGLAQIAPVSKVSVRDGESSKSLRTVEDVCARLVDAGATRSSFVVAVGGGTIGNIAGLCASLLFRGIGLVQVPTTLLAVSDAVLSLKQAVNLPGVKNGVGAYYAPRLIWADPAVLDTLRPHDVRAGLAEIIKNALVVSPEHVPLLLGTLRPDARYESDELLTFVELALASKAGVLRADPKERGEALVLEYGHTVGHALEVSTDGEISHGISVAFGMRVAAQVASRRGVLAANLVELHDELVAAAGLPLRLEPEHRSAIEATPLAAQVGRDNKRGYIPTADGEIAMVLLADLGQPLWTGQVPLVSVSADELVGVAALVLG